MRLISALLFASSALLSLAATAQIRIYCCDDTAGRKVCGDFLPAECRGRAYEERDSRGFVSKRVEAPLTAEQQARRDAEMAKKEEAAKKAAEERRRELALLSTYSSEKDIETARDRALAETEQNMKQSQLRLDEAKKKRAKIDSQKEFYKGKPLPDSVKADLRENDKEIKAHQSAVDARLKDMEEIRVRFAAERKRYLELTSKKAPEGSAAGEAKPADKPEPAAAPAESAEKR